MDKPQVRFAEKHQPGKDEEQVIDHQEEEEDEEHVGEEDAEEEEEEEEGEVDEEEGEYETEEEEEEEEPKNPIDKKLLDYLFAYDGARDNYGYYEGEGKTKFRVFESVQPQLQQQLQKQQPASNSEVLSPSSDVLTPKHSPSSHGGSHHNKKNPFEFEYEGTFSRGLMNGEGLIKWNDRVQYKGHFVDNTLNGTGRMSWSDGSYYEGTIKNGLRQENGVYIHNKTRAKYDGEWYAGMRHGHGKLTYSYYDRYEGDFFMNKRHGKGLMTFASGNYYEGEWRDDKIHGYGVMHWVAQNEKYEGYWSFGMPHGEGRHTYYHSKNDTCNYYEGQFRLGKREGKGTFYYADGSRYEGQWKNNLKHGRGEYCSANGTVQVSIFEEDNIVATIENEEQAQESKNPIYVPLYIQDIITKGGSSDDILQIQRVISRFLQKLKQVFDYYSKYGVAPEVIKVNEKALEEEVEVAPSPRVTPNSKSMKTLKSLLEQFRMSVSILNILPQYSPRSASKRMELIEKQIRLTKHSEMNMLQFWRLAKDCNFIARDKLSFAMIDRIFIISKRKVGELALAANSNTKGGAGVRFIDGNTEFTPRGKHVLKPLNEDDDSKELKTNFHSPENKMRFREFVEALVRVAAIIYDGSELSLSNKVQKLIEEDLLTAFDAITLDDQKTQEELFMRQRQEYEPLINQNMEHLENLFKYYSLLSSGMIISKKHASDITMTVRQFLRMMQDNELIDGSLTLHSILTMFDESPDVGEDKKIIPELIVDREIIFAEFLEAIIKCSLLKGDGIASGKLLNKSQMSPDEDPTEGESPAEDSHFAQFLTALISTAKAKDILV